jgi:hypothetical protein
MENYSNRPTDLGQTSVTLRDGISLPFLRLRLANFLFPTCTAFRRSVSSAACFLTCMDRLLLHRILFFVTIYAPSMCSSIRTHLQDDVACKAITRIASYFYVVTYLSETSMESATIIFFYFTALKTACMIACRGVFLFATPL